MGQCAGIIRNTRTTCSGQLLESAVVIEFEASTSQSTSYVATSATSTSHELDLLSSSGKESASNRDQLECTDPARNDFRPLAKHSQARVLIERPRPTRKATPTLQSMLFIHVRTHCRACYLYTYVRTS